MNKPVAPMCPSWLRVLLAATLLWGVGMNEARADSFADEMAMQIKNDPSRYYFGEGTGATLEEARTNALSALSQAIKSVVWTDIYGEENEISSTISARTGISSFTTLTNTETIEFPFDRKARVYRVMQYIERSELKRLAAERAEKIRDWVATGIRQEARLEISNALKYYYWALCLCDVHSSSIKIDVNGDRIEAKPWLESKIGNLLNSIEVTLDNIEERPGDANPYLVNLRFTCKGQRINGLQLSYYTGLRRVGGIHAKNGEATLEFPRIPTDKISLVYEYAFADDGSIFDPELNAYFRSNDSPRTFVQAKQNVAVHGTELTTFAVEQAPKPQAAAASAPVVADVQIAEPRKRVATQEVLDPQPFVETMQLVESAIHTHNYAAVRECFTPEGYDIFMRMVGSGNLRIARTKGVDRRIEQAEGYIIGKPIPVQITYKGNRRCNENIVLRFTPDGKISSVAYALSARAEDDIFRKNLWGMKARYAMLTFMEDYQTAFALKDIDYIDKIFASNAVIINAVVDRSGRRKASRRQTDGNYFVDPDALQPNVRYTKRTKQEYLDYLRRDFSLKNFIQIIFEETDIAWQSGIKDSVYWIELKQNYTSNTYSDVGYLTLMIDLDEIDSYILVRTWTPEKLDLHEMMNRYTQD